MKINITIEDATLEEARHLLGGHQVSASIHMPDVPVKAAPKADPKIADAEAEADRRAKDAAAALDAAADRATEAARLEAALVSDVEEADDTDVLQDARNRMKETKNVGLSDGSTVAKGHEVTVCDTGEVGVVLATFRGNACIEFEDGSRVLHKTSDLASTAQSDEPEPETTTGNGADESVSEKDVRDAARALLEAEGAGAVAGVFKEFNAKNVSEVPAAKRMDVLRALQAAAL